jgi:hypothetical protein
MQPMTVDSSQMNSKLIENLFLIDINWLKIRSIIIYG